MADFVPRTFEQIIDAMVAYVQGHSEITDFSPGSATLTLLEAAAFEDEEQYFQMSQILEIMSIFNARGERLRRRVSDFGIFPVGAKTATGKVRFYNSALTTGRVGTDYNAGVNVITLFSTSMFPTSGFPYEVYLAEGTNRSHLLSVTANDPVLGTLSFAGLTTYNLVAGDRVSLKTGDVLHTVNSGIQLMSPATASSPAKLYTTQETAYIYPGNYYSNEVRVKAVSSGTVGNLAVGQVTRFAGSAPFNGAGVYSTTSMEGGKEAENDADLLERYLNHIKSLSRGTVFSLKAGSQGVEQIETGQRVISANVVEDFNADEVIVYIDDGTGFIPDTVLLPFSTAAVNSGGTSLTLTDGSQFPSSGFIIINNTTIVGYTNRVGNILTLATATVVTAGNVVEFVDYIAESTESFQSKFRLAYSPVVRNTESVRVKIPSASTWSALTRDADYIINRGTGDLKLLTTIPSGSALAASYSYFTGLIASVQKVLEGDPADPTNFPGIKAAGINLSVEAPSIRRVTVRLSIQAKPGYTETDLYPLVRQAVENYITSLKLGENVIVSRIIDSAHNVEGVYSVTVSEPLNNLTILEHELPVPYQPNGSSLVTVI